MLGIFVLTLVGEDLKRSCSAPPFESLRVSGKAGAPLSLFRSRELRSGCDDLDGADHAVGFVAGEVADEGVFTGLVEGDGGLAGG